ncbi:mas-related G-protein coupled receptor member H-like [Pelodiscus sinensis]|uniref:mas-related G-protein coupled receptor member H-like n=1 Tax=Pelodiscus sinensis TaxID=13735 RepID=UPI003F6C001A
MAELSRETLPPTASGWDYEYEHNDTECRESDAPEVTFLSITLIICLLGLVGNGIVIWFLGFRMKRNPFTVYVLNLAIADTGFLLFTLAYLAAYTVQYLFCDILSLFAVLCLWMYSTSLYLLTAISTERCVSVLYPIWHRCHRPRHLSATVSALLWALSSLLCCSVGIFCLVLVSEICFTSFLYIFVLNVLIFSPAMVLSSLILFIKVQRSSQRRPPGKLYVVILLTVLFFLLFTLPESVDLLLTYLRLPALTELLHALTCASSSINPVIYYLVGSYRKRRFRGSLKLALQRVFEEQADSGEDRNAPSTDPKEMAV